MHTDVFTEIAASIAKNLRNHLAGAFGSLIHEIDPANAHYRKGKRMFACKRFCRIYSCYCKVLKATISWNAWLSFARNISGKCTFLRKEDYIACNLFIAEFAAVDTGCLSRQLAETFGSLWHEIYLENT